MENSKPKQTDKADVAFGALAGCIAGILLSLIFASLVIVPSERRTAWIMGFSTGSMAVGERAARQRNDLPLADWYKAQRAIRPEWDLDPVYTKEVIEGR